MGWVCSPRIYEYKGWVFEFGPVGCWPLKKDWEPRKRAGRKFWAVVGDFMELSEDERTQYRVGGGCQQF